MIRLSIYSDPFQHYQVVKEMPISKTKKRKRTHNERNLTEAEIWDDSALIKSWNAAVKEYEVRVHTWRVRDSLI